MVYMMSLCFLTKRTEKTEHVRTKKNTMNERGDVFFMRDSNPRRGVNRIVYLLFNPS